MRLLGEPCARKAVYPMCYLLENYNTGARSEVVGLIFEYCMSKCKEIGL